MSCWDGDSHHSSGFAKLLWEIIFITPVRETLISKIGDVYLIGSICSLLDAFVQKQEVPSFVCCMCCRCFRLSQWKLQPQAEG